MLSSGVSCGQEPEARAAVALPGPPPTAPHGDHAPRYGGVVFMHGDLHFEVVLATTGRYRVYFSDASRAELPASAATEVVVTVTDGSSRPPQVLPARIDEAGESWIAEGAPVVDPLARARVAFVTAGGPYFIDLPFAGVAQ
jgi:hypothetical protein